MMGDIMNKFKINVVVELEKENAFETAYKCKKILQKKYGLNNKECSEVYINIVKYQVNKYGSNLAGSFLKTEKIKRTDNIYKRVKYRR